MALVSFRTETLCSRIRPSRYGREEVERHASSCRSRSTVELMTILGVGASVFAITSGLARGSPAPVSRALEMDISSNGSNMTIGEPEIAVNPNNPNQLYVDGAIFPTPPVPNEAPPVPNTCGGWGSDNGGFELAAATVDHRGM
jgi:hypothetical protein